MRIPVAFVTLLIWIMAVSAAMAAPAVREPVATDPATLKVAEGFQVELLYTVPKEQQGSWVNMCLDPHGRMIVSDQYGGLYRVTLPPLGSLDGLNIEKIPVDIGEAQGLLWAFDSLYVVVNKGRKYASGLYRVRDTDGDDQLDQLETLRLIDGGAEHGPHAILLAPDGKSLYVVCGNRTKIPQIDASRVPRVWDEDNLLPRPYGRGFMKGTPAPGGFISRIDPDGKKWELVASGFRNQFDAAFNADGELFTYDADMEWDMNTPWYRPTRVCHVVSGAEFGWRNGGGKWPVSYPDSVPPIVNIGPGSPTGVCFGYGAKFPPAYQNALFICDWSYGKMYAVHLTASGASYAAQLEDFLSGTPLPLTDLLINPHDGAMYFAIGGRKVQSGLYRVTYKGDESTAPAIAQTALPARTARRQLEALHLGQHADAVDKAWPHLSSPDRFLRFAARIALEHQPVEGWREQALQEADPRAALAALLALVRQYPRAAKGKGDDIDSPPPVWSSLQASAEPKELTNILAALERIEWQRLSEAEQVELLRVYSLAFLRLGPSPRSRDALIAKFDAVYPTQTTEVDAELAQLLVYLQAPTAAAKTVALLQSAPTQEEQIQYAKTLRHLTEGWNDNLRKEYFNWFIRASGYKGGASFALFVENIKQDAVAKLTDQQRQTLKPILNAKPAGQVNVFSAQPRPFVKAWTFEELAELVETGLKDRDFEHGRKMFAAANCFSCHRFDNQGGAVGPDLTALSGRFSPRDILESVVSPSKVISDQYAAVQIVTDDGQVVVGRIVNLAGDTYRILTNMLDPKSLVIVDRRKIE